MWFEIIISANFSLSKTFFNVKNQLNLSNLFSTEDIKLGKQLLLSTFFDYSIQFLNHFIFFFWVSQNKATESLYLLIGKIQIGLPIPSKKTDYL